MDEKDLDQLLSETLGADRPAPDYLNTRLRGALNLARKEERSVAIWWVPMVLSLAAALFITVLCALMPLPLGLLAVPAAWLSALGITALTVVGLARFDLRRKGRITL